MRNFQTTLSPPQDVELSPGWKALRLGCSARQSKSKVRFRCNGPGSCGHHCGALGADKKRQKGLKTVRRRRRLRRDWNQDCVERLLETFRRFSKECQRRRNSNRLCGSLEKARLPQGFASVSQVARAIRPDGPQWGDRVGKDCYATPQSS